MAQLEFKLYDYDVTVLHITNYAIRTPLEVMFIHYYVLVYKAIFSTGTNVYINSNISTAVVNKRDNTLSNKLNNV